MRVLLATGEHRQQKGSKAYTLDICKTSLSQKIYFQLQSNSELIRARSQPRADGSAGAANATKPSEPASHRAGPAEVRALKITRLRGRGSGSRLSPTSGSPGLPN